MNVALVTCRDLPSWEKDDRPLFAALESRGCTLAHPVWNDPAVDWARFDAALIRTTWDYHDHHDAFVRWARDAGAVTRLLNPPEVVAWNSDKTYLRALEAAGIPVIPTSWCPAGSTPDLDGVLAARGWSRAFLKPVVGASASGTMRFDAGAASVARARAHLAEHGRTLDYLLQPYLEEVETRGEVSVIMIDGEPTHAVRKIPVPGDYRVQDDYGAQDAPEPLTDELRARALDVLRAAPHADDEPLLYARADFLGHDGAVFLTELELIEPSLFFRHGPEAADRLADGLVRRAS